MLQCVCVKNADIGLETKSVNCSQSNIGYDCQLDLYVVNLVVMMSVPHQPQHHCTSLI